MSHSVRSAANSTSPHMAPAEDKSQPGSDILPLLAPPTNQPTNRTVQRELANLHGGTDDMKIKKRRKSFRGECAAAENRATLENKPTQRVTCCTLQKRRRRRVLLRHVVPEQCVESPGVSPPSRTRIGQPRRKLINDPRRETPENVTATSQAPDKNQTKTQPNSPAWMS